MPSGGSRPNSGRKTKAVEQQTANIAKAVIAEKYGSLEKGLEHLLTTAEPALIKFVFEHAFGKSPDKIEHSGNASISLNIVRTRSSTK